MYGKCEVLINKILLDRVLDIKHSNAFQDESLWEEDLIEQIKLTRLGEMVESLNKDELAALVLVALERYPELVYQILFEEYKKNKENKNDSNNRSRQGTV